MQTTICDQYHDPSFKQLFQILQSSPQAADGVKTACANTELDDAQNEKRANSAFAWPERRLFPIDSPEQALLSSLYVSKQAAAIPEAVRERCARAVDLYGVQVPQVKTAAAPAPATPDEYLLPDLKRFRVRSPEDVKLASETLLRDQRKLDTQHRTKAAVGLVRKSAELRVAIPDAIYKMAGVTYSHTPTMRTWLEARAAATKNPAVKYAYLKLAEHTRAMEEMYFDRAAMIKTAEVIGELDAAAGLDRHYGRKLPDPVQTVFNTDKIAEETMQFAGKQVPVSQLLAISPDAYRNAFGDDLANEFISGDDIDPEQLRVILPTVPMDLQKVLATEAAI